MSFFRERAPLALGAVADDASVLGAIEAAIKAVEQDEHWNTR